MLKTIGKIFAGIVIALIVAVVAFIVWAFSTSDQTTDMIAASSTPIAATKSADGAVSAPLGSIPTKAPATITPSPTISPTPTIPPKLLIRYEEEYAMGGKMYTRCLIKGNINSKGDKIYHIPGSTSYDATKIDTSAGERWFCTEYDAIRAGWHAPGQ